MTLKETIVASSSSLHQKSIEIEDLLHRLEDLCPTEMAQALYTLEFHHKFSAALLTRMPSQESDETCLIFSRGLKNEIQTIYLELARHLKANNNGATDLMNRVFEFFNQTMKSLVKVPHLVSSN